MVLAGVGIDHKKLVDLGNKYFSVPKSDPKNIDEQVMKDNKAVWTGGWKLVMRFRVLVFKLNFNLLIVFL
jgi:hypothetical protein